MSIADELAKYVEEKENFPVEGITFLDTAALTEEKWGETIDAMLAAIPAEELKKVEAFVGLEARGFAFAGAMAKAAPGNVGLVKARKAGKLPDPLFSSDPYDVEYRKAEDGDAAHEAKPSNNVLEIKPGNGKRVIIVDDVLATGGTLESSANLCEKAGYDVIGFATLINLSHLNNFEWKGMKNRSVLTYDENGYVPVKKPAPAAAPQTPKGFQPF
ncbi:MAG: adenine phosphoribosyltransferase [Rhodospirillales bacterium]|nr:adenine phosphoribosyltransferase [Rhodospirillales bacterium]